MVRIPLNTIGALAIIYSILDKWVAEMAVPEYQMRCDELGIDPIPEGYRLLNRVKMHLEVELRKN